MHLTSTIVSTTIASMRKYKREVLIPTGDYANEKISVEFDFDDKVPFKEAWAEVDEALDWKADLVKEAVRLDKTFKSDENKANPPIIEDTNTKPCPLPEHEGMTMTGKEGQYGYFYSHKLIDGTWCNGKPKIKEH